VAVNPYVPIRAKVKEIREDTSETRTFVISPEVSDAKSRFAFRPGQFLQLTVFGVGEAPISVCSSPEDLPLVQMSIRRIGTVTEAMHDIRVGDFVGLRGPYGNGWPVEKLKGRDVVLVAGGIGMAPLRPLMSTSRNVTDKSGSTTLCYGARNPSLLMYKSEFPRWTESGASVKLTVDQGDAGWNGRVGVVPALLDDLEVDKASAVALTCGPPVMIKFTARKLAQLGYKPENIYASLESMMRCGIGKCGHCHFGSKHVCLDGPVFSYSDMLSLPKGLAPI
jgi:sulfhydrogenase subunit gamma (sulfur reductase)